MDEMDGIDGMDGMDGMDMTNQINTPNTANHNTPIIEKIITKYKLNLYKFRICFGQIALHLWFLFFFIIQRSVSEIIYTAKICLRLYIRTHTRRKGNIINCGVLLFNIWFPVIIKFVVFLQSCVCSDHQYILHNIVVYVIHICYYLFAIHLLLCFNILYDLVVIYALYTFFGLFFGYTKNLRDSIIFDFFICLCLCINMG